LNYSRADFTCKGEITNRYILPRILVTFVENAFKHGLYNDPLFPLKTELAAENNNMFFTVENKINPNKKVVSLHTGAVNVRQVLETYYRDCHRLNTVKGDEMYRVELLIESCEA
jgi:two-component system, LytTR family, sensor kinase